jgi:dTDP-4-dehydrorhamnose reductase
MYARSRKTQFPTGIYHLSAAGATSWYGFASAILSIACPRKAPIVIPTPTTEHASFAKRPKNALLSCQKFLTTFGFELTSWQQQLEEVVAEVQAEIESAEAAGILHNPVGAENA